MYWNRLQKTQDEIYTDVVLRRSRGSPGQWFPETDYLCASAIFVVGTSGILPKLNYRSVKSYNLFKIRGSPHGVVVNGQGCDSVVSSFKLQ